MLSDNDKNWIVKLCGIVSGVWLVATIVIVLLMHTCSTNYKCCCCCYGHAYESSTEGNTKGSLTLPLDSRDQYVSPH